MPAWGLESKVNTGNSHPFVQQLGIKWAYPKADTWITVSCLLLCLHGLGLQQLLWELRQPEPMETPPVYVHSAGV